MITDQYGNPITSRTFFKGAERYNNTRPSTQIRALDPLKKLLTYRDWLTLSYLSDKLFGNFGIVKGAICQKSMYAVGNAWAPVFEGEAKDWGMDVKRWLMEEWYPTCDVRGPNFDFVTSLYLDSITTDRSGDSLVMLTYAEDGKWPMLQRIPPRQIGQESGDDKVTSGPFKGAIIRNGVILNKLERPIGFRKLGENPKEFTDIPATSICHIFDPEWQDQCRGLPLMSASIEEFRDIAQSDEWERQAMLIASSIGLIEYNESGTDLDGTSTDDPLNADNAINDAGEIQTKLLDGGIIRYFKAGSGNKLEQFTSNRPTAEWDAFQDRQVRKALAGANWPYSMVWKADGSNGTVQRSDLNKAKMSVTDRQSLIKPHARRMVGYAVSAAIKSGIIPAYPGKDKGGFLKWGFTLPPRISIDEGRDRSQRREDNKAGLILDSTIVEEDGNTTYEEFCIRRARDIATRESARQQVEKETGITIDPREMKMLTANDMAQTEPKKTEEQP